MMPRPDIAHLPQSCFTAFTMLSYVGFFFRSYIKPYRGISIAPPCVSATGLRFPSCTGGGLGLTLAYGVASASGTRSVSIFLQTCVVLLTWCLLRPPRTVRSISNERCCHPPVVLHASSSYSAVAFSHFSGPSNDPATLTAIGALTLADEGVPVTQLDGLIIT
jgi:hypothetical protein